jgi:hypothetical protein
VINTREILPHGVSSPLALRAPQSYHLLPTLNLFHEPLLPTLTVHTPKDSLPMCS